MTGAKEENCVCYCHIILAYLDYGIRRCSLYIPMCCVYYLMEQQRAKSNSCRLVKPVSRSGYVHLLAPGLIFRNRSFARLYLYATAALKRLRHSTLFILNKFMSRDKGIGGASSAPLQFQQRARVQQLFDLYLTVTPWLLSSTLCSNPLTISLNCPTTWNSLCLLFSLARQSRILCEYNLILKYS